MRSVVLSSLVVLAASVVACSSSSSGGVAPPVDAGAGDSNVADSGPSDSGTADSGAGDTATTDSLTMDSGTTDSDTTDSGTTDAGTTDAATTDAGDLDAANDTGSGDVGVDAPSDAGCGVAGVGTVDQAQTSGTSTQYFNRREILGETFTAGATGILTGIEVSTGGCGNPAPAGFGVILTVYDEAHNTLGSAEVAYTPALIAQCPPTTLGPGALGNGYFDVSSACIPVVAGQHYAFDMQINAAGYGACSASTHQCTVGSGSFCSQDSDCDVESANLKLHGGSDVYPGGVYTYNGALQPASYGDALFRTFVTSGTGAGP